MGNTALTALRNIADSNYLIKPKGILSQESSIYYDVAGLFMLTYSFNTYLTLNYNLIIVVLVFIAWAIFSFRKHGLTVFVVLRSYLAMILSFVAAIASSFAFAAILNKINPMLVYGEHWLGFMFFVFQCCTVIICVQWGWVLFELSLKDDLSPLDIALERMRVDTEQIANVGMVLFWWTLLIAATVVGRSKEIGMYYFLTWFVVTSMISAYLSIFPRRRGTAWTLGRLWINFIPLMMVLDIAITNMNAMSQTLVDGTPPFASRFFFLFAAICPIHDRECYSTSFTNVFPHCRSGNSYGLVLALRSDLRHASDPHHSSVCQLSKDGCRQYWIDVASLHLGVCGVSLLGKRGSQQASVATDL